MGIYAVNGEWRMSNEEIALGASPADYLVGNINNALIHAFK